VTPEKGKKNTQGKRETGQGGNVPCGLLQDTGLSLGDIQKRGGRGGQGARGRGGSVSRRIRRRGGKRELNRKGKRDRLVQLVFPPQFSQAGIQKKLGKDNK